jgi:hypothetical protein
MTANQKQVGGIHYKADYQHWDFVIITGMGYLEGCSTKYVTRWRKAKGIEDLLKGQHYLEKLIESYDIYNIPELRMDGARLKEETDKFAKANNLIQMERDFIYLLCSFQSREDLVEAMALLVWIVTGAEARDLTRARGEPTWPGTPENGGHHSKQEDV